VCVSGGRSGFAVDFPPMDYLKAAETFSVAKLSAAEVQEILKQVEADVDYRPKSWQDELSIRHVRLGLVDGLVLQGLHDLCGATGNCTTWVFRRERGHWASLFFDYPPSAQGFGFEQQAKHGIRNLVTTEHDSAFEHVFTVWSFNGKAYEPNRCYDVIYPADGGGGPQTNVKPCD
jgi:hypothetical protein